MIFINRVVLTKKLITDLKTKRGGYTRQTYEWLTGESWPPKEKGWIGFVVGKEVEESEYLKIYNERNNTVRKKRPSKSKRAEILSKKQFSELTTQQKWNRLRAERKAI